MATSGLSAQNGMHGSAAVNAVTKSGTNTFHGNVFEFLRHRALNATNPFATIGPDGKRQDDGLLRNQFGRITTQAGSPRIIQLGSSIRFSAGTAIAGAVVAVAGSIPAAARGRTSTHLGPRSEFPCQHGVKPDPRSERTKATKATKRTKTVRLVGPRRRADPA